MMRLLVITLLAGTFAHADNAKRKKPPSVVARVVALEVVDDQAIVTVTAGTDQGVTKNFRARFREGATEKLLPGGDAVLIRVDRSTAIVKTKLSPAQIRANKHVQFDP